MSRSPGHVFVVHGDLRALACDAWLMPTDIEMFIVPTWLSWPEFPTQVPARPAPPAGWGHRGVRTVRYASWPWEQPTPWLTHVGGSRSGGVGWFVDGARQFLEAAGAHVTRQAPRHGRARHLLALPIVGTGYGGARHSAGEVVAALLPVMRHAATTLGVDVALVTNEGPAFAAAQAVRRAQAATLGLDGWPELDDALRGRAEALAALATRGELVLFLGAGVSRAAGLPLWGELIARLADTAGIREPDALDALWRLGPLDQARVIERQLGGSGALNRAVVRHLTGHEVALGHSLLAALPVREIVTTNYDRRFEYACAAVGVETAVLPWQPASGSDRWLLKMHGCVTRPDDIVLTRQDYLRYAERRAALAGIVQTLLITKHMLFVGFSLEDDNFHRIADAVRKALHEDTDDDGLAVDRRGQAAERGLMGSSLVLRRSAVFEQLWDGDLRWIGLDHPDDADIPTTARRLEIFLDYMLAMTGSHAAHLLDRRYDAVLSTPERELRDALHDMVDDLSLEARQTPAFQQVRHLLERLGYRTWSGISSVD